jgi:hypothetical protein
MQVIFFSTSDSNRTAKVPGQHEQIRQRRLGTNIGSEAEKVMPDPRHFAVVRGRERRGVRKWEEGGRAVRGRLEN